VHQTPPARTAGETPPRLASLAGAARTVPVARRLLRWEGVAETDQGAKRRRFEFPPRRLGNLRVDHYLRHACPYRAIRDQVPASCGQVADKGILPLGALAEKGGGTRGQAGPGLAGMMRSSFDSHLPVKLDRAEPLMTGA